MNILYYDCFAGISGDMNLGALINLGVPKEYVISELKKLDLDGYQLEITETLKMGISGIKVSVKTNDIPASDDEINIQPVQQKQIHTHTHIHVHQDKDNIIQKGHEHAHRNLNDIKKIINDSDLDPFIKEKSLQIFQEIGIAEAKIHSKSIDEIHFHEVGAIDSIIDIVGAAICIHYLKPDKILCSTVELGGGFVNCAHGIFPVPAPATAEILKKIPVKKGMVNKETTTPTGAAILKVFVNEFIDRVDFSIEKIAYGIGHRDLEIPNVLRVYLGNLKLQGVEKMPALLIESNIDDMNPENYEYIMDMLFDAGAQDVWLDPIIMKKSRPAIKLTVLCDNSSQNAIEQIILNETTSLGLRCFPVLKSSLKRKSRTIETIYGSIQIKEAYYLNDTIKYKAEYEDCIRAAKEFKVSLKNVYYEVDRAIEQMKNIK